MKQRYFFIRDLILATTLLFFSQLAMADAQQQNNSEHLLLNNSQQIILVIPPDWNNNQAQLYTFERNDHSDQWKLKQAAFHVSIGRAGSGWGIGVHPDTHYLPNDPIKKEGDGRSPAGIFTIGTGFGYAAYSNTGLPYQIMNESDFCVDVASSPLYNQIVDTNVVGKQAVEGSTEPMRRDLHEGDSLYKNGFVIQHNPDNKQGAGSCIFAHLWRNVGQTTAGCTAMEDTNMEQLLHWLDAKKNPLFVLLPQAEYQRLQKEWQLPQIKGAL